MSSSGDDQLYANVLDAVRLANASRRRIVTASGIASFLGLGAVKLVGNALRRAAAEGYVRSVPAFRCIACGTQNGSGRLGPAPCVTCKREMLHAEFMLFEATSKLLSSGTAKLPPRQVDGGALDRLDDADRVVPIDADPGGTATAVRATAFGTAKLSRDRAAWTGAVAGVVALAVTVWFGVRQEHSASRVATDQGASSSPAALYASEADARAHCGTEEVVFANARSHIFHPKADSLYGIWNGAAPPQKGYGCTDELLKSGYRKSLGH
jgi:hypothetical protein